MQILKELYFTFLQNCYGGYIKQHNMAQRIHDNMTVCHTIPPEYGS